MNLSPTRRHADEFARLLETSAGTDDPTLSPLVSLAHALQATPAVAPRAEFRDALRQRLVAVASVQAAPEPVPTTGERVRDLMTGWRMQRRLVVAVAGAAALVVVGGVGVGASRSLPGEPLYGVKRVAEGVQLATAGGDYGKGQRHLQFARTRLGEVDALVGRAAALSGRSGQPLAAGVAMSRSTTNLVIDTLQDMNTDTVTGSNDLTRAYAQGHDKAKTLLATFAVDQRRDLTAVLPALPPDARAVAETSLALLGEVQHQANVLAQLRCDNGSCTTAIAGTGTGTGAQTGTGSGGSGPTGTGPTSGSTLAPVVPGLPGSTSAGTGVLPGTGTQPQQSGGSTGILPGLGVTSSGPTLSPSPSPIVTLSPVPLPTVTLPSLTDTVTTLLSPSPSPSSSTLLPLPLPTLPGLGG